MSAEVDLTPVQRAAAVERLADNLALCSGAGCGKTMVLARRFAELLRSRPEVEDPLPNFVALTFTEKAALEMSQRVRRTLREFSAAASPPERRRFRQWLEALPEARISTIHGFCAALLRGWAVEAGLDPAFAVADESDLVVRRIFGEAAEKVVLEAVESGDAVAAGLIERGGLGPLVEQVETLADMRTECDLGEYLDPARTLARWGLAVAAAQQALWGAACRDEKVGGLLDELESIPCADAEDKIAAARDQLLAVVRAAIRGAVLPGAEAFSAVAAVTLRGGSARAWGGQEAFGRAKELIGAVREWMGGLAICGESPNRADEQAAKDLAALARLAEDVRGRFGRQKRARGLLDFTDLLEHAGRLLSLPPVAQAVRGQIHQLLLDEAQDTDTFQIRMLEGLLFGEARGALPAGRLFLVGDPKQSIYRFRGARVEVFEDLCRRLGEANRLYLDLSFRAHRQTAGFVNHLFARLMGEDYVRIEARREAVPPQASVEVLLAAAPEDAPFSDAAGASRAQAAVAAQRLADMVAGGERLVWDEPAKDWRPVRWGDIAVLFSRMTDSLQYERELALRDVPYYVVAGTGFFQQQEVLDVLNALAAIDNPFDDVALMGALRSSLFGLDDNALAHVAMSFEPPYFPRLAGSLEEGPLAALGTGPRETLQFAGGLLGGLHRRKDAVPIDRLIGDLLEQTAYEAVLLCQPQGRRLAGNVRRLMELARPGAAGPVSLGEFLAQMREHVLDESRYEQAAVVGEAEDVVRLMTVHKAKGLEFPVVVLPDLSAGRQARGGAILRRPDLGLTYRPADALEEGPDGRGDPKPLSFRLAGALEAEDLRKEDVRRLYVGATRSQDHLVFVGADWRGKDGRLLQSGSHLRMMDEHLHLAACADGGGELEYGDDGRTYYAVVRRVAPRPAPRAAGPPSRGRRMLADARSPEELSSAILAAASRGASPPLVGPLPDRAASVEVAVTALGEFEHCPMLYRWRYELGVPPRHRKPGPGRAAGAGPDASASLPDESADSGAERMFPAHRAGGMAPSVSAPLEPAELGTLLHRCMELLDFARPQPAEGLISLAAEELGVPDEMLPPALRGEFRRMLETFLGHPLGRQLAAAPRRLAELEFLLQEGPLRLAGKIDLLWQDPAGLWHIVDYKSDRVEGRDLADYARRYELQLAAYAMAASRHLAGGGRAAVADAGLYFLRSGAIQSLPITPEVLGEAARRLARVSSGLIAARRTGEFPRCQSPSCEYCPYADCCGASACQAQPAEA